MIKVTLLGDSIRMIGYGKYVPEILKDEFEVFQPEYNCCYAKLTLRGLFDWKEELAGTRIVHWNNGLWDTCDLFGDGAFTSEDEYIKTMIRVANVLQERYDKVIFATTTPVSQKNQHNKNSTIERYNEIIVPILKERGIIINDLYSLLATDVERYISDDTIHLTEESAKLCANQVADYIREAAKTLSDTENNVIHEVSEKLMGAPV